MIKPIIKKKKKPIWSKMPGEWKLQQFSLEVPDSTCSKGCKYLG